MQSLGRLNVDDGIRTIEVNDKGEYISFSINDSSLTDRFCELVQWFGQIGAKVDNFSAEFEKKHDFVVNKDDNGKMDVDTEALMEVAKFRTGICKEACEKIDGIFGEGSCSKVFGDIVPDEDTISEFLRQLLPFIEQAGHERMKRYAEVYNPNRKGSGKGKRNRQYSKREQVKDYGQKSVQYPTGRAAAGVGRNTDRQ